MARVSAATPAPPGPRGLRWSGNLAAYEQDRLGFLLEARDRFGGVVAFDDLTTIVNDPDLAHEALVRHHQFQIRSNFRNQRLSPGAADATTARRRHLNAGLRPTIAASASATSTRHVTDGFRKALAVSGKTGQIDILPVLEDALSTTVTEQFFGTQQPRLQPAVRELLEELTAVFGNPFALPAWVPTARQRRIKQLHHELRRLITCLLAIPSAKDSELSYAQTVASSCRQAGETQEMTTDLLIGSLLASQRVPAAAAAWALLTVADRQELQTAIRQDAADPDCSSSASLRGRTNQLDRTLLEVLRLYPPTWMIQRTVTSPARLGQHLLPVGHQALISPYVIHRDPRLFESPLAFVPDRWLRPPPRGFIPFGHGIRACPGANLAMVTLRATTTAVLANWHLHPTETAPIPDPRSTLVPRSGNLLLTSLGTQPRQPAVEDAPGSGVIRGAKRSHAA